MDVIRYAAAGGIIIHENQMLLLNRPTRQEVRLPKGHIDGDETPEEAALREAVEETGFSDLAVVGSLGSQVVEFEYQNKQFVRTEHYFLMRLNSTARVPRPKVDEAQFQPIWVAIDNAADSLTYEAEQTMATSAVDLFRQRSATSPAQKKKDGD